MSWFCPLAVVECPYAKYNCAVGEMFRKDLLEHKKEFYIEYIEFHQDLHTQLYHDPLDSKRRTNLSVEKLKSKKDL